MAQKKEWADMSLKERTIGVGVIVIIILLLFVVASALLGGGTKNNTPTEAKAPPKPANTVSQAPKPVSNTPLAPANTLTEYGADQAVWDSHHKSDSRYVAGSAYDPTTGLGYDDKHNDKFYAFTNTLTFQMRLPQHLSVGAALAEAMKEFPTDTQVVWQHKNTTDPTNECYQVEVKSAMLATATKTSGMANIELNTEPTTGGPQYDANNLNSALLAPFDYASAADANGC